MHVAPLPFLCINRYEQTPMHLVIQQPKVKRSRRVKGSAENWNLESLSSVVIDLAAFVKEAFSVSEHHD
jgi:hypothetical protein